MARKRNLDKEVLDLVYSGNYDIAQQFNGGDEEPYEGCEHNLYLVLESSEANVSLLDESDPRARKGSKTYTVEYSTFFGNATLIIWEI